MWNVKTKVIPVITGATGTISKSFRKYVSNIPGKHEVEELQEITAIQGTLHILHKVQLQRSKTFLTGNVITCAMNCKYRIAATLNTLET